ncbi:MAG: ABC-2 transporter permease [Planifilum fimeticola]
MKSLLYKDFLALRTFLLFFLASVIFLLLIGFIKINALLPAAAVVAMTIPFQLISVEEKNNSHIFVNSLPVNRNAVVRAKYLFTLLVSTLLIGGAKMVNVISELPSENDHWDLLFTLVAVCGFTAAFYPLYYWLGPIFVKIGLFVTFIVAFGVAPMLYNMGVKNNFWGLLEVFESYPSLFLVIVLLVFTALMLFFSLLLSSWLYRRKDF